jgi:hypothetical protein
VRVDDRSIGLMIWMMCELRMINFLSFVSLSLISRRQISFLAFHGCTAGNPVRGYGERLGKPRIRLRQQVVARGYGVTGDTDITDRFFRWRLTQTPYNRMLD